MNDVFIDACVSGWEALENAVDLPDVNDRHVLAAAIQGRADVIVTNNVRDFPSSTVEKFNISVQTPDDCVVNQLDLDPGLVLVALQSQLEALTDPPMEMPGLLDRLERCGMSKFSAAARAQQWRAR